MTTDLTPNFRALCAELVDKLDELNCNFNIPSQSALIEYANDLLATPPPEPPADGDREENERLRSLFELTRWQIADALGVDRGYGWTSLAMEARQLREDRALVTPPPEPPTELPPLLAAALKLREENDLSRLFLPKPTPPPKPPTSMDAAEIVALIQAHSDVEPVMGTSRVLKESAFETVASAFLERWGNG